MSVDLVAIRDAYTALVEQFDTVLLGTVSNNGLPDASYAPYVYVDGYYYVYVSELATHTGNLLNTDKVSLLFIENEQVAKSLFARRRVTYQGLALEIPRGENRFVEVLDTFATQFGSIIKVLRDLEDFRLIQISPASGRFVAGFGKAYDIAGNTLGDVRHINDQGHGRRRQA